MLGVVVVAYQIPDSRKADFLSWNLDLFGALNAMPFVVCESDSLPCYVKCDDDSARPANADGVRMFSLSATKNLGIRAALKAGCDRIVTTDIDVAFTKQALMMAAAVGNKSAVVPMYRMAIDFETREEFALPDKGMAGTIALTAANWRKLEYDERYIGYGGEDGKMRKDIASVGIREVRTCHVYHIAHDPTAPQVNVPGAGRNDCWNRDTINPDNWEANRHLIHQ